MYSHFLFHQPGPVKHAAAYPGKWALAGARTILLGRGDMTAARHLHRKQIVLFE